MSNIDINNIYKDNQTVDVQCRLCKDDILDSLDSCRDCPDNLAFKEKISKEMRDVLISQPSNPDIKKLLK